MAQKLIFTIVSEQGYIFNNNKEDAFSAKNDILFSAITCTYLPLLALLRRLEADSVPCALSLVLSPTVCTLLENPRIQKQYIDALNKRIALGKKELERNKENEALVAQIKRCIATLEKSRLDFTETYSQNLIPQFAYFAKKNMLELIPTAATYAYLPHYADLPEALNAQVETGLYAARTFFSNTGEGFFLPYMGFAHGIDVTLRSYGINYTILDPRAILFSESPCTVGIFAPVRTRYSLVCFAKNPSLPDAIVSPGGLMHKSAYRNQERDIGFELDQHYLADFLEKESARVQTGFKYWANALPGQDVLYNEEEAKAQAKKDAAAFLTKEKETLCAAALHLGKDALSVYTIPAYVLGQTWHEGLWWLEEIIRLVAQDPELELSVCKNHLQEQFTLPKITPYPCANKDFAENLLDNSNSWMQRYIRKATERLIDLTDRFPSETGLKARLLNLGTREVLLAQSSDWARMIQEGVLPDYAKAEFKKNIQSFTAVFDSLASNTVSTEWLTQLEKDHPIFPWMNYRIFSRKR